MPANVFGDLSTAPVNTPNATISFNRDGSLSGTAIYKFEKTGVLSILPTGTAHPFDSDAFLSDKKITWEEPWCTIDASYMGVWSSTQQEVDCICSTSQDPIQTHRLWASTIGGTPSAPLNLAVYDPNGDFLYFPTDAPNSLGGVTSYLNGGLEAKMSFTTDSGTDVINAINSLGHAASSVTLGLITFSASYRQVLVTNVTYKEYNVGGNGIWQITLTYSFTQANGWNSLIYP